MLTERVDAEHVVAIKGEVDVVLAGAQGKEMAAGLGFDSAAQAALVTAVSEVARNILHYAGQGQVAFSRLQAPDRTGLSVVASDQGPGIADLELAMKDGYSTGGGLGLGLPGARRLMDEFEICSAPGQGTVVRMSKWLK